MHRKLLLIIDSDLYPQIYKGFSHLSPIQYIPTFRNLRPKNHDVEVITKDRSRPCFTPCHSSSSNTFIAYFRVKKLLLPVTSNPEYKTENYYRNDSICVCHYRVDKGCSCVNNNDNGRNKVNRIN